MSRLPDLTSPEARASFARAFADGRDSIEATIVGEAEALAQDLERVERLIATGRQIEALKLAARNLKMEPTELLSCLPEQSGASLLGYVSGLASTYQVPADEAPPPQRVRGYGRG